MEKESAPTSLQGTLKLVVCGGGASAVLLLAALRRRVTGTIDVTVVEPRDELGLGVAYSTQCPLHVLNTRARNMSANDESDDFYDWLRTTHRRRPLNWTRNCFAPRKLYGEYLQSRLQEIRSAPDVRFHWVRSAVDSVVACGDGWEVIPAKGVPLRADVVVLATGNEAPRGLAAGLPPHVRSFVVDDPWDATARQALSPEDPVLLVGTGLTAVDVVIELLHRGHTGPIYATSRRGLLPRRHGPVHASPADGCGATLPTSLRDLVRHVRKMIESDPRGSVWQGFVNEMRSHAPTVWSRWSARERRQFLRHVRPFWDVHRHRIAPPVYSRIHRAIERGQLKILKARVVGIEAAPNAQAVTVRLQQAGNETHVQVARAINCTGPETDPRRASNTLLRSLLSDSLAQPDSLGLGLFVDQHSRVVAANGSAHPTLFALGPVTRGSRWEVTAVAEIRDQAVSVARRIARDLAIGADRESGLGQVGDFRQSLA